MSIGGVAAEDRRLQGLGALQLGPEAGQVPEAVRRITQLPRHHAIGVDQHDFQAPGPQHLHRALEIAAATEQPDHIGAARDGHQVEGDLHLQVGPGVLALLWVVAEFAQGLGAHAEAQVGEGIAEGALVGWVLQAQVPEGAAHLQVALAGGPLQQPARIKEPTHLLLGVEHAVAINHQGTLHRWNGCAGAMGA